MKALAFDDIRHAYQRGSDVLNGVTFSVEPAQVVGLLGKNGAGKTTLMRIAMGMIEAQGGTTRVLGLDPRADAIAMKRRVGYVSEDQILPPFMKVREVLDLHRGLFPTWDDALARKLVGQFDLPLDVKIRTLSKGQARRIALTCASAHRPEVLLLDEPASGLDPAGRREFLEASIQLLNESGTAILFSSHYMTDVERMAGRVVMLHDGKVLIDDGLDDLRESFSLALVPREAGITRDALLGLDHCLGVRERPDGYHAILRLQPSEARAVFDGRLSIKGTRCQSIVLEDMFVELVGGQSS